MDRHRPALDWWRSKQVGAGPVPVWIGRYRCRSGPVGVGRLRCRGETARNAVYIFYNCVKFNLNSINIFFLDLILKFSDYTLLKEGKELNPFILKFYIIRLSNVFQCLVLLKSVSSNYPTKKNSLKNLRRNNKGTVSQTVPYQNFAVKNHNKYAFGTLQFTWK